MVKVIQVTGLSGSGKTTFIRTLIPILARFGPVGTVKHTGHHSMELPQGKDTTVMFSAGASAVAGIDGEKTLVTIASTSLAEALDILSGRGIAIAVVEGYKESPLPKIVIGDIDLEGCILRNPDPEDVIRCLDRFPDYITPGEILRELEADSRAEKGPATIATSATPLSFGSDGDVLSTLEQALPRIVEEGKDLPGVIGVRAAIQHGILFGRPDELLIAIAAGKGEEAASALEHALSRCRDELAARSGTLR
ncbi:MAG: molybdopterin-guanine dinucleotide biosynthesis protein B [Methanomicrobiales archaeon]|nr:molybdopterin-guanine dinucleotide biosynthesis protein B [Methanomicrobiales archaeon]